MISASGQSLDGDFKFVVYKDEPRQVLWNAHQALLMGESARAMDIICQFFAAENAQTHADAAVEAYKQFLAKGDA